MIYSECLLLPIASHCAPLREVCLHLLYAISFGICRRQQDLPFASSSPGQTNATSSAPPHTSCAPAPKRLCPSGPPGPFLRSCSSACHPHLVLAYGLISAQGQDVAFAFIRSMSFLQPAPVSLNSSPVLPSVDCSSQFGVICQRCVPSSRWLIRTILILRDGTAHRLPVGLRTLNTEFEPGSLANFPTSPLIQFVSHQFGYEDAMGSHAKGLAKVKVNKPPCFPLIYRASPFTTEGIRE